MTPDHTPSSPTVGAETTDVRENWSVADYGVATPDEVEKALGWIAMEDAALSYRVGACFMRAGASPWASRQELTAHRRPHPLRLRPPRP